MTVSTERFLQMPEASLTTSMVACFMLILAYYLIEMITRNNGNGIKRPPAASHWFPLLSHTRTFASGSITLALTFLKERRENMPVRFHGIGFDFILITGTNLVRKALTTDSHLDWNHTSAQMFGRLFNAPKKIRDATAADDSGVGVKPYPGSSVHPGQRLIRNQVLFFNDAFSKKSMDEIVSRFLRELKKDDHTMGIGNTWRDVPDLYMFLRKIVFRCEVVSFFGHNMLRLNPDVEQDFTEFDDSVSFLATGLPRFMNPRAFESRARCLAAVKRWRQDAVRRSEEQQDKEEPEGTEWDPAWGLRALKRRNKLFEASEGLFDEDATAATDLATMWAFTSNLIPGTFWLLFEILRDENLYKRAKEALACARSADGSIDTTRVMNNPLLQSVYAEVLRVHTGSMMNRTVKKTHELDSWLLKKDQTVVVSSHVEHHSAYWNTVDSSGCSHPPEEFWADRFLTPEGQFSLEGMQGKFMPYGMGEHMCPGRHFAKHGMLLTFAVLMDRFDIEIMSPKGWRPDNDFSRYGVGALHPKQTVGARIRRSS